MKIHIKNLGVIREAKIDLDKDLIVFCGRNNTGKTWVNYAIYGLSNATYSNINHVFEIEPFIPLANQLIENGEIEVNKLDILHTHKDELLNNLSLSIKNNLDKIFGLNNNNTQLFYSTYINILADSFDYIEEEYKSEFNTKIGNINISKKSNHAAIRTSIENNLNNNEKILNNYANFLARFHFSNLLYPIYFAVAEREAINLFSSSLANESDSPYAEKYPLPIKDNIRIAEKVKNIIYQKSEYAPIAEALEQELLQGKVYATEFGNINFKPNEKSADGDEDLPLKITASSVKSLAGMLLHLKHAARRGDILMIDEPELNLHPDSQRILARALVKLANNGLKIIMSTHSDYIVREINNMIMLGHGLAQNNPNLSGLLERYPYYDKDCLLTPEQMGVYLFEGGNVIEQTVTPEGFSVPTIDQAISELNQSAQDIYYNLLVEDED